MKQDKPPLRKYLVNELKKEGYLSLDKITAITISLGHKQDTARRILNKDMSKEVETIYNEKKQIIGYKLNETNTSTESRKETQTMCQIGKGDSEKESKLQMRTLWEVETTGLADARLTHTS